MRLIDDWKSEATRLWSLRVVYVSGAFWSAIGGLWIMWPVFAEEISIGVYIIGGLLLSVATGVARVAKQPGAEQ